MTRVLRIDRQQVRSLAGLVAAARPHAASGFLLGDAERLRVRAVLPARAPRDTATMSAAALAHARAVAARRRLDVIAWFHSHPGGTLELTRDEKALVVGCGLPLATIVPRGRTFDLALWRVRAHHHRHALERLSWIPVGEKNDDPRNHALALLGTRPPRPDANAAEYVAGLLHAAGVSPDPRRPMVLPPIENLAATSAIVRGFADLGVDLDLQLTPIADMPTASRRADPRPDNHDLLVATRLAVGSEILAAAFSIGMIETDLGRDSAEAMVAQLRPAVATTLANRTWTGLALVLADAPTFVDPDATGDAFRIRLPLLLRGELDGTTPVDVALDLEIPLLLETQSSTIDGEPVLLVTVGADIFRPEQGRIFIADDQPLHPVGADELAALAQAARTISFGQGPDIAARITVPPIPPIALPGGGTIRVANAAAVVLPSAGGAEVVVAASLVGSGDDTSRPVGVPRLGLLTPASDRRAAARIDVFAIQVLIDELIRQGALDDGDIEITSAAVSIDTRGVLPVIVFDLHGTAKDACDVFLGAGHLDVDFDLRVRGFFEFSGDEVGLRVEFGEPDRDDGDLWLCVLANVGVFALIRYGLPAFAEWIGMIGSDPDPDDQFFRLRVPFHLGHVPQTESILEAPVGAVEHDDRSITLRGDLRLVDDSDGHYFYFAVTGAVEGDEILVVDQDSPRPAGDDALVVEQPERGSIESTTNDSVSATDDVLGREPIEVGGITQVRLSTSELHTRDGSTLARVRISDPDAPNPFSVTQTLSLMERRPDLYFRVVRGGEIILDSRRFPNRRPLLVNFTSGGVGSPAEPIVLTIRPIVFDDDVVAVG